MMFYSNDKNKMAYPSWNLTSNIAKKKNDKSSINYEKELADAGDKTKSTVEKAIVNGIKEADSK